MRACQSWGKQNNHDLKGARTEEAGDKTSSRVRDKVMLVRGEGTAKALTIHKQGFIHNHYANLKRGNKGERIRHQRQFQEDRQQCQSNGKNLIIMGCYHLEEERTKQGGAKVKTKSRTHTNSPKYRK